MKYDASIYASKDYKRSRLAYMNLCHTEWFVHLLCMDAFLAKLLTYVGVEDGLVGVITTIASLSSIFRLFSFAIVPRVRNTKRYAIPMQLFGELMFVSLYLIPVMGADSQSKSPLMVLCIVFAYLGYQLSNSIVYRWGNSFVDPHHRAEFTSTKEMISSLLGMAVSFSAGFILDYFDSKGDLQAGFLYTAIAMLVFVICEMLCMASIKNEIIPARTADSIPIREVLEKTLGNRNFRNLALLYGLYNFAINFTIGFLGTYQLQELSFPVSTVTAIGIVGTFSRVIFSKPIGRYSDRKSFAKGIELGMLIALVGFICVIFTGPQSRWLIVAYSVLYLTAQVGAGSNFINSTYSYVDNRCFVQGVAILMSVSGVFSFAASLAGSALLTHIQANGNVFWGIPVYGQQVLALITVLIILGCLLFNRAVVEKQEIMIQ